MMDHIQYTGERVLHEKKKCKQVSLMTIGGDIFRDRFYGCDCIDILAGCRLFILHEQIRFTNTPEVVTSADEGKIFDL